MKFPKNYGRCRICGKETKLTFEHVPPQKAYNSHKVMEYSFEQMLQAECDFVRMPWDNTGINGKINQKGGGGYYLCQQCNNDTGSWYIDEYVKFVNTIGVMLQENNAKERMLYDFTLKDLYPLKIFKSMITMILDTNMGGLGDENLRDFLLNKESNEFDVEKYQVYAYLVTPDSNRITGLMVKGNIEESSFVTLSEVAHYPVGFTIYVNKPKNYEAFGVNVSSLVHHSYDEKCDISFFGMPYVSLNSFIAGDYRTKDEIRQCVEASRKS